MAAAPPSLMLTVLDGPLPSFAELPARFKCVVCHDVLKDPWQTECGHRMCVSCMTGMFQTATPQVMCPANDEDCEIISRERMFYDRGMCREILSQHVYCSYKNAGCSSLMKWSELHNHVEKCEFVTVDCPFKKFGCPDEVAKKTVDEHVKGCGYVPVPCPHCTEEVARTLLESHIVKDCPNVDVPCPYGCKDRMLRNQIEAHTTICAMRPQKCQYHFIGCTFEGCESEVRLHQQTGHFDILVRHVAHVDLKQSRLKTQLEEVINESKLLARKLNEANQKINRKDSCLTRIQETIEPMKANSAKFATKTELNERHGHFEETLSVNKGQIIEVEQRVSELEKGSGSSVRNLSAENLRELVATTQQVGVHDIRLAEMEVRFQCLETANYGGVLIWKVPDYTRRKLDAATNRVMSLYSQPFYTSRYGYKMCGRVYLNGDGMGKGTHLSLFFVLMRGEYDALIEWPFRQKVTLSLLDQSTARNDVCDTFRPDPSSSSFRRPTTEMNIASGCPMFIKHVDMQNSRFLKDDVIYMKIVVDPTDLVPR